MAKSIERRAVEVIQALDGIASHEVALDVYLRSEIDAVVATLVRKAPNLHTLESFEMVITESVLPAPSIHDELIVAHCGETDAWEVWLREEVLFSGTEVACDQFVKDRRLSDG